MSDVSRTEPMLNPWWMGLRRVQSAVTLAELRCAPTDRLIACLDVVLDGDFPEAVIDFLQKNPPDDAAARETIADKLVQLLDASRELRGARARLLDRVLYRLIRLVPPARARPLGIQLLVGRRKVQRRAGYRALHLADIDRQLTETLLAAHAQHGDREALALLARFPNTMTLDESAKVLVALIDAPDTSSSSLGARVIQRMLAVDARFAADLAAEFPVEAAWAIGRTREPSWLPLLRSLYESAHDDPEFVSLYVWAVGVIGSEADLSPVRNLIEAKEAEVAALFGQ